MNKVDYLPLKGPELLEVLGDDAAKWAEAFLQHARNIGYSHMDEGWLITWFANAIEHSGDVRRWRAAEAKPPAGENAWSCTIGGMVDQLPRGADLPMRKAVERAYQEITGVAPAFMFSGWGAVLDEVQRAVVEDRLPTGRRPTTPIPGAS